VENMSHDKLIMLQHEDGCLFLSSYLYCCLGIKTAEGFLSDIFEMVQYSDTISLSYMIHVAYSNISQSTNFCYDMLINK